MKALDKINVGSDPFGNLCIKNFWEFKSILNGVSERVI